MGKKKRQAEPNMDNDNDSTESCDENQNATFCPHITKAVDLGKIKKSLGSGLATECPMCEKHPLENGTIEDDFEYDLSLWLCLRCGNQGCGRSKRKHALNHFNKPRSDCHALCVNTTLWHVWCYECDDTINPNSKKKLLETVEWLKKQSLSNSSKLPPIALEYHTLDPIESENLKNTNTNTNAIPCNMKLDLPRVRGLANLGNTCFFNAVMQCLAQTPFLMSVLQELEQPGEHFTLPGGKLQMENAEPTTLPPLSGVLKGWGSLTEVLFSTLKELTSGRMDVHNPRSLLAQLTLRQPLFGGGDQHDSHELLRYLLEAVRSEDLRRYQLIILESLGLNKKTDPSTVEGITKQIIKFYGQQASDLMVKTDQVFRGILVSTLQCQDCKHSSHRDEFFLDLSLPVSGEKQMPPSLRRKSDVELMETEQKPSKYQQKKEKRAARKARKQQQKANASNSTITEEQTAENKSESEESDADVEDNLEDCKSPGGCEEPTKGIESGYNSEKVSDASPELNVIDTDSGVMSPLTVAVPSPLCADPDSPNSGSSEANIELPSPQLPSVSPEDYERPISRLSFADKPTPMMEDKIQPMQETSESSRYDSLFGSRWGGTVSARYQCDEGECSVQSCLNQFTSCELMTGNNRVRCENCTKNSGEAEKSVNTNATKQLLISSPPAVLILHLKRFQVSRCFPRKMCKHVTFPLVLDMAPFCSNRCRDLPSIDEQQNRLLYSLYGIVEHSGTMHGGHYVAYVKVRPNIPADNYRWQFLAKAANSNMNTNTNTNTTSNTNSINSNSNKSEGGAQGDPSSPPGKWYYVSDSYVAEVSESKVLKAQAYLLFYERIL